MVKPIRLKVSKYVESASEKKREFVRTKYKLKPSDIPLLEVADPTPHGEYLDWLAKQYSRNNLRLPEDTQVIKPTLELFHGLKNKAVFKADKDINSYKNPGDLYEVMEVYEEAKGVDTDELKRRDVPGAEVFVRGSDFTWYRVTTPEAACSLGSGTKWCTVPNADIASDYLNKGPLYILYKGGKPVSQVHFESGQFMDTRDRSLGDTYFYRFVPKKFHTKFKVLFDKVGYGYEVVYKKDMSALDPEIVAKDPQWAYKYATDILKGPFPAGEGVIAKDPCWAHYYALDVLDGPFPAGEAAIAKDPQWAYYYAFDVLKGPFPAGEAVIAKHPFWAYDYAINVLEGPFPAGEAAFAKHPQCAHDYARYVLNGRFPAGEAAIAKDPQWAYEYAKDILKGPFPASETAIAADAYKAFWYALYVLKGPFPAGEAAIAADPYWAYFYARDILKGPFPAGEEAIATDPERAREYVNFLNSKGIKIPPLFI